MTSTGNDSDATVPGARTFQTSGPSYDAFMGRYSRPLAVQFAEAVGVTAGMSVLDLGCGPGALTTVLVDRLGAGSVSACDPSPPFVAECLGRNPGIEIRQGRAEAIPFDDAVFDAVLVQLVLHFISDPARAAVELRRVLRPHGTVAACVWDSAQGMEMLRCFWEAARTVDPDASDEQQRLRFGRAGEIIELFDAAGFVDLSEDTVTVSSTYADFDELWSGFLAGIGPAGKYCLSLTEQARTEVRSAMFERLGSPAGTYPLDAVARCAWGRARG